MKRLIINLIALMTVGQAFAQTEITGKEWDNPLVTSVNRETAHTLAIPDALGAASEMSQSPWYQSLDGVWKFQWVGVPTNAKEELGYEPVYDVHKLFENYKEEMALDRFLELRGK